MGIIDARRSVTKFVKLLRTGGTLAIWLYGRPIFAVDGQAKSWQTYNQITAWAFDRVRPFKGTPLERA